MRRYLRWRELQPACELTEVAFIGLGAMGSRMARRLILGGLDVTVWNRTSSKIEPLVAAGARAAGTPAGAARAAGVVITMVRDAQALRAVTAGSDGVLSGLRDDSLFIEMSTVGPSAVHKLSTQLPVQVALVDAPVLGSTAEATEGTLQIFVGGSDEDFACARPFLAVLGQALHVGDLGSGAAAKLMVNSTLFGTLGVLGEAIALGDALGLSRTTTFAVLATTPSASQAARRRSAIESRDYPPRFPLALARKDAELILAAADEAGVNLRLATATASLLAAADARGLGGLDYSALLKHIIDRHSA
jgi:3-hydroxyisobutyrate dehydrogenase-like beta-hydroxyacid dehydrogenase